MARPVCEDDRRQVAELHAQGLGRNDIATAIGRAPATVTKIAGQLGLSFDRSATAAATAAKVLDAKARRAQLALNLLDDAARLREQLWQPAVIHNFGGRDNTYNHADVPEPLFADKLRLVQAAGAAIDRALRLEEYDSGDTGTVGSLLGSLFDRLQAKHGTGDDA